MVILQMAHLLVSLKYNLGTPGDRYLFYASKKGSFSSGGFVVRIYLFVCLFVYCHVALAGLELYAVLLYPPPAY